MIRALLMAAAAFVSTPALAVSFDFEFPTDPFVQRTAFGVTITAGGNTIDVLDTPNGTRGLLTRGDPRPPLRADFDFPAEFVSIDLGDYGVDADLLFLDVYGAGDVLLGSSTLLIDGSDATMHTLSIAIADVRYAIFGARSPAVDGSSAYADNLVVTPQLATVPEPASWALLIAGFGAAGGALRRRATPARAAV